MNDVCANRSRLSLRSACLYVAAAVAASSLGSPVLANACRASLAELSGVSHEIGEVWIGTSTKGWQEDARVVAQVSQFLDATKGQRARILGCFAENAVAVPNVTDVTGTLEWLPKAQLAFRVFMVDGRYQEAKKNVATAVTAYVCAIRAARLMQAEKLAVGIRMSQMAELTALASLRDMLVAMGEPRELQQARVALDEIGPSRRSIGDYVHGEGDLMERSIRSLPDNKLREELRNAGASVQDGAEIDRNALAHELSEYSQRVAQWLSGEYLKARVQSEPRPRSALLHGTLPYWGVLWVGELQLSAQYRLTVATIALLQYHTEHGRYPDKLDAGLLGQPGATSVDPFSGDHIRYLRLDRGCLVYSVGPDLRDDNGARMSNATTGSWDAPSRGDIAVRIPER